MYPCLYLLYCAVNNGHFATLLFFTCGVPFTPALAMCCQRGGFPTICHNEVRDFVGYLLSEVCHKVANEPLLAPLRGFHQHC